MARRFRRSEIGDYTHTQRHSAYYDLCAQGRSHFRKASMKVINDIPVFESQDDFLSILHRPGVVIEPGATFILGSAEGVWIVVKWLSGCVCECWEESTAVAVAGLLKANPKVCDVA